MNPKIMSLEDSKALDASKETSHKYWYAALKGEILNTHPEYVPCGFYRYEQKNKPALPLVVYLGTDGVKRAQIGNFKEKVFSTPQLEGAFAYDTFQYSAGKAITYEAYEHWKENGDWPPETGVAKAISASQITAGSVTAEKVERRESPGIGDNSGASPDIEHETFLDQVKAALAGAKDLKVEKDEDLAAANGLRNRLTELASEGDKKRVVEKEPHLAASRAVDSKWNPAIKEAKGAATAILRLIEAHETAKLRKRKEEEAARAAAANPVTEAPKVEQIQSTYGKKSSVKTRKEVVVVDQDALYQSLRGNTDVQVLLKKLAQRVVDAGSILPGCETTEVASVR